MIAPGFIDIHTHSDFTLPANRDAHGKVRQGVTLEVVGNCGTSAAPRYGEASRAVEDWFERNGLDDAVDPTARASMADYLDHLAEGVSLNVASLVDHGNVRAAVVGYEDRAATAEELGEMRALVAWPTTTRARAGLSRPPPRSTGTRCDRTARSMGGRTTRGTHRQCSPRYPETRVRLAYRDTPHTTIRNPIRLRGTGSPFDTSPRSDIAWNRTEDPRRRPPPLLGRRKQGGHENDPRPLRVPRPGKAAVLGRGCPSPGPPGSGFSGRGSATSRGIRTGGRGGHTPPERYTGIVGYSNI